MRRAALLPVLLLLLVGCSSDPMDPETAWVEEPAGYVGAGGVELELPAGWRRVEIPASDVSDPVVQLAVSSSPLRPQRSGCQIGVFVPTADAVAVVVVEWRRLRARGRTRPLAFDQPSLRLGKGSIECHAGRGGSASFVENGRAIAVYVLVGQRASAALVRAARQVVGSLRVAGRLPAPVQLVRLGVERQEHCRSSRLLRPICPTLVPRVNAPYLSHLSEDVAGRVAQLDVFDLNRGAEIVGEPERNRPPRMAHIGLLAGETERIAPWQEPWHAPARPLRDGVLHEDRSAPVSFGLFDVVDNRALLFLAPPFPHGGYLGNHLVLVWRHGPISRAVSLHAWEPLREAAATLHAIAVSATAATQPWLDARTDADGVLYVDGGGWACNDKVLVDLPPPWAETHVRPNSTGVFHLQYARPTVKPYTGTVRATQRCTGTTGLRVTAKIVAHTPG